MFNEDDLSELHHQRAYFMLSIALKLRDNTPAVVELARQVELHASWAMRFGVPPLDVRTHETLVDFRNMKEAAEQLQASCAMLVAQLAIALPSDAPAPTDPSENRP